MENAITIETRGEFGQWAIEVAKQIVSEHGFELARAAGDGSEDDVRAAVMRSVRRSPTPCWKCMTVCSTTRPGNRAGPPIVTAPVARAASRRH
jgi:hypothetical protein